MNEFLMFYAPFIVLILGLIVSFIVGPMDATITEEEEEK